MDISGVVGTSWPWKKFPVWLENDDVIDTAIRDIIFTGLGERKMNNTFGSDTFALVFENKGPMLDALARREISLSIRQHLPVVNVLNIDVIEGEKDTDPVDIVVSYEYLGILSTVTVPVDGP
jgi:phage baseplate assembly protein W